MKPEELKDKILKVLDTMEESIKKHTQDKAELDRIQKIKDYINNKNTI